MSPSWSFFFCFLLLNCASCFNTSASIPCAWRDLYEEEFIEMPHTIQIKARNDKEGTAIIEFLHKNTSKYEEKLKPRGVYELAMSCDLFYCRYRLVGDGKNSTTEVFVVNFKKFVVKGKRADWKNCAKEDEEEVEASYGTAEPSNETAIWIYVLAGVGVAVTVVAVGALSWGVCQVCRRYSRVSV